MVLVADTHAAGALATTVTIQTFKQLRDLRRRGGNSLGRPGSTTTWAVLNLLGQHASATRYCCFADVMTMALLRSTPLLLLSLWPLPKVSSFFPPAVVGGHSRSNKSTRRPRGLKVHCCRTSRSSAAAPAGGGFQAAAPTTSDGGSSAGVPSIVVSFGLTREERLAAERVIVHEGKLFPSGVRILDGSRKGGRTLREVSGVSS